MKSLFPALLCAAVLAIGCQTQAEGAKRHAPALKALGAVDVFRVFGAAGIPVTDLTVFDAVNDPNHLLGRPGQYVSKVSFFDARHPKDEPDEVTRENTVEVFATPAAAKARRDYIARVTQGTPFLLQYQVLNGKVLARFDTILLPAEVEEYRVALAKALAR